MELELPVFEDGSGLDVYPMEEDEDEVMGDFVSQTQPMVLGELFEDMDDEPHSTFRKPRGRLGWSWDDLGGEGMTVEDLFSDNDVTSTTVTEGTENSSPSLGTIQWDALQTVDPNKIFAISIEYIVRRAPQFATTRRISKK